MLLPSGRIDTASDLLQIHALEFVNGLSTLGTMDRATRLGLTIVVLQAHETSTHNTVRHVHARQGGTNGVVVQANDANLATGACLDIVAFFFFWRAFNIVGRRMQIC